MAYEAVPIKLFTLDHTGQDCTGCPVAKERQEHNEAAFTALRAYDDSTQGSSLSVRGRRERVILPTATHDDLLLNDDRYREAVATYEAQHAANIATKGLCRSLGGARETIGSGDGVICAQEFLNEE